MGVKKSIAKGADISFTEMSVSLTPSVGRTILLKFRSVVAVLEGRTGCKLLLQPQMQQCIHITCFKGNITGSLCNMHVF